MILILLNEKKKIFDFFIKNERKIDKLLIYLKKKRTEGIKDLSRTQDKIIFITKRKNKDKQDLYRCKKCNISFYSEDKFEEHSKQHLRDIKCVYCRKTYSRRYTLTNHIKNKHNKEYYVK